MYYATTTVVAREIRAVNEKTPIVFSGTANPLDAELGIKSIERPERDMTGFVSYEDIDNKRIEILADLDPRIKRIGVLLWSFDEEEFSKRAEFAQRLSVELIPLVFWSEETDPAVLERLIRVFSLDAIDAPTSAFVREHYRALIRIARAAGIPLSFRGSGFLEYGGVLAYEPREFDYPIKAAQMVARILKGTAPADMPIEFPSEFTFAINLEGIHALPYAVNKALLRRANKVFSKSAQ